MKALDIDPSSYGNLLVPLINAKLPNELRRLVSRKFENEVWLLSGSSNILKLKSRRKNVQLVSRISIENVLKVIVIIDLQRQPFWRPPFEELPEKTNRKRVFCNSITHPLWRCLKISNPQRKRKILGCVLFVFIKDTLLLGVLWAVILVINVKETQHQYLHWI